MNQKIIVTSNAEYKIDHLLEEAITFNKIQDKMDDILEIFNKKFSTKSSRDAFVEKEKAARKRREDYLKKNNIDISQFKKDLKAGKDVKVSFIFTIKEIVAELKGTHPIEMVKTLTILAIVVMIEMAIRSLLPEDILVHFFVMALVVAPLVEELLKRYSVKNKTTLGGLLAGNSLEIGLDFYAGDSILDVLIGRPVTVLMHTIATIIHAKGNIKDEYKKDFNIKTTDKNKYKNEASKLAILIHSLTNLSSLFRPF